MKIIDAFMFFNELDLLEVRLHELSKIVDVFVIVESHSSHSGKNKPLFFFDNKARFEPFLEKIRHLVINDMPTENSWLRERHQRQSILRVLDDISPGDWLLISDADEIPRADILKLLVEDAGRYQGTFYAFEQKLYYHFLNLYGGLWQGTKALRIDSVMNLRSLDLTNEVRYRPNYGPEVVLGREGYGGWHFSSLGDAKNIQYKIENFAHTECVSAGLNNLDIITASLETNKCLLNGQKLSLDPRWDPSLPLYIRENSKKFAKYFK